MSDIFAERPVPKAAVIGAMALVILSLGAAVTGRWTGVGTLKLAPAPAVEETSLTFADRPDGAVVVVADGDTKVLNPGTNGFIRGVLRGLARDRRARGIGAEEPFRLVRRVDGRLTLEDPATGRTLDLGAFGPTNAGAFARLLRQG